MKDKLDILCDKQGHFSPPFTRWGWITCSLEFAKSWLKKSKYNPPFSSAQCKPEKSVKHWLVVKQRRMRSDLIPLITSRSQKSKRLACYRELSTFSSVDSLTKACISQNSFTSVSKKINSKSSSTWLIPTSLCEGPFLLLLCWVSLSLPS